MAEEHQDKKRRTEEKQAAPGGEGGDEEPTQELIQLEGIQSKLDEINDEALEKAFEVEREFNKKRRPVYLERQKVLAKIPAFWQATLYNHPLIREMVTDDDLKVLEHCTEVDVEEFEDIKSGYKITLRFDNKNPYFSEMELFKEFHVKDEGEIHVRGNVPTWKPGMAQEEGFEGDKASHETEGHTYRFMMWFVESETLVNGQQDPLADIVKDEIWPNPVKFYNREEEDDSIGEEDDSELVSGEEYEEGPDAGAEVYEEEGGEDDDDDGSDDGQA